MSRYALPLSGYEDCSIWGYDSQAQTYFAQLWHNDSDSRADPDIWLSGMQPIRHARLLAQGISARTGTTVPDVLRAMGAARTAPEAELLREMADEIASGWS